MLIKVETSINVHFSHHSVHEHYDNQNVLFSGVTQSAVVPSCQTLCNQSPPVSSGVYWPDPDGGS